MLWIEIVIGTIFFLFAVLGVREGALKAFISIALIFFSISLSTTALETLSRNIPQLTDPRYLGTVILFLALTTVFFVFFDLILGFVFKRVVVVTVLGPVDKVTGFIIGAFKGCLITGLILQSVLMAEIPLTVKESVAQSYLSRFSVKTYELSNFFAKKVVPQLSKFMQENMLEVIENNAMLKGKGGQMNKEEITKQLENLLKEQKIIPSVPQENQENKE